MARRFELIIFTAARQDYADQIIDHLDPKGQLIAYRLYRQHCDLADSGRLLTKKDFHVKSVSIISNRKKEDVLIVDNLVYSYAFDLENGIPIKPYMRGQNDSELEYLAEILSPLQSFVDSRTFLQEKLKLSEFYKYALQY